LKKRAIIIGAGPAGLTAAIELLQKSEVVPLIVEETNMIGGISQTANHKGNRIDIGGHRFFSKSDRVMTWWQEILPVMGAPARDDLLLGRKVTLSELPNAPDPERTDKVMLVRRRVSRILFLRKFFDYPVTLSLKTLTNLGLLRVVKILSSYLRIRLAPIRPERSLEDFFINRFGRELYATFFRDYTEKVWGVPCRDLPSEWGAQRVKGLSVFKTIAHALGQLWRRSGEVAQKSTETSLIEQFLYPKFGPGQLWEAVAADIQAKGGELRMNSKVTTIHRQGDRVVGVTVTDPRNGQTERIDGDVVFSSMPVRDLVLSFDPPVDEPARDVARGLVYRDFITVGLLLNELKVKGSDGSLLPDNWIYVQEPDVRLGRIQVFNNWSPYMVADPAKVWLGLEYFCNEGDDLWTLSDESMAALATDELARIGFIERGMVVDSVVIRMPKAYPAYLGSYREFSAIRNCTDQIANLFLMGRNGMHRYNNMDHSMLTAMTAVSLYLGGSADKDSVWRVNAESDYHESK
jgi:protoporphyrinogen oxidase